MLYLELYQDIGQLYRSSDYPNSISLTTFCQLQGERSFGLVRPRNRTWTGCRVGVMRTHPGADPPCADHCANRRSAEDAPHRARTTRAAPSRSWTAKMSALPTMPPGLGASRQKRPAPAMEPAKSRETTMMQPSSRHGSATRHRSGKAQHHNSLDRAAAARISEPLYRQPSQRDRARA